MQRFDDDVEEAEAHASLSTAFRCSSLIFEQRLGGLIEALADRLGSSPWLLLGNGYLHA